MFLLKIKMNYFFLLCPFRSIFPIGFCFSLLWTRLSEAVRRVEHEAQNNLNRSSQWWTYWSVYSVLYTPHSLYGSYGIITAGSILLTLNLALFLLEWVGDLLPSPSFHCVNGDVWRYALVIHGHLRFTNFSVTHSADYINVYIINCDFLLQHKKWFIWYWTCVFTTWRTLVPTVCAWLVQTCVRTHLPPAPQCSAQEVGVGFHSPCVRGRYSMGV